jgi:hypothetical protein
VQKTYIEGVMNRARHGWEPTLTHHMRKKVTDPDRIEALSTPYMQEEAGPLGWVSEASMSIATNAGNIPRRGARRRRELSKNEVVL